MPFVPADSPLPARSRDDLSGLRVLVVDDNATNRTILEHQVATWNMESDTATGGKPALAMAEAAALEGRPYDLALLDFNMPGLNGADLTRALRADPRLRSTRILILTSSGAHAETATSGADGVVSKPVRQSELLRRDCRRDERTSFADANLPELEDTSRHAGVRVLVAEDNQINQLVISTLLEPRGFDVDIASNGQDAVYKNARNHYAAIFMDCQMLDLDGYEATEEIRRREGAQRHVPIIAMTAHTMKGDREKCLRVGMDDYMGKPVRSETLDEVLERALPLSDPPPDVKSSLGSSPDRLPEKPAVVALSGLGSRHQSAIARCSV